MFKSITNNSPIHNLILTARIHEIKGEIQEKKNNLRNALSCYSEGIELKCKNDKLNFSLYLKRSRIHQLLGKFRRHIHFLFQLSEFKYLTSECKKKFLSVLVLSICSYIN